MGDFNTEQIIIVTGETTCSYLENLTKAKAMEDLSEIKRKFSYLISIADVFKEFAGERKVEYNLICDYGNGGITICSEIDVVQKWCYDLNQ